MPNPIGRRDFLQRSVNVLGLAALFLVSCSSASNSSTQAETTPAQETMNLESPAFDTNEMIPSQYTCDGEDISPALNWDAPPTGTQSLALIVDDPDAPNRTFVHWVAYDIAPEVRQLPEGIPTQATLANGGTQGENDFGNLGYGGPCPPSGTHRYFFKLYALDRALGLESGATKAQLEAAMSGHILGSAELIGRYSRS
ncbi:MULTISPECIES: YbhB/YbcL family Raf kinase inhibitor-like protein [unclassified Coleofasciculus]|uniref:YbhB/YbcL family Raf kinase inhibitor-like protein n=1 Tax=unclassified Coleofasciculus TaxID=2692782 RepID=UPI0018815335|nr:MULTISPECIES: YbhB/YbcL family Raf kinase inhibitor-like protein [unclassified Coleofasciculus]MBE9126543.1 YbhB/YbcL family Raf kinase inhibitor-like protein [Coleofasciculus sp. LEGE 07081]MBE9149977.1 YbhB/YbcL family Raf kinase inhibitor-like protein [Coleofasciculus sp. LEGE 07092]